jgi:tetratricopeptide (TPR) repeat protein
LLAQAVQSFRAAQEYFFPRAVIFPKQAVEAYRAALKVYTKADLPQEWAGAQNNLGITLWKQGVRSSGAQSKDLIAQSVQAFQSALEVRTKADIPQGWAETQNNLGNALMDQGERSSGAQSKDLIAQSVQAFQSALEVRTKADIPQGWAETQNNLGNALVDQGELGSGAHARDLFAQAVQAFQSALEVRIKADIPQGWAETQNNLGIALMDQAARTSGAQATDLLVQAVKAYRAALEVRTNADVSREWARDWAMTENNLGNALSVQATRRSGAQATDLLAQAVQAYRAALEVYTKANLPQDWAATQINLGRTLTDQGERSTGAQATELLAQAVKAYQSALEVDSRVEMPHDWAEAQSGMGKTLADQGDFSRASHAIEASMEILPIDIKFVQHAASNYYNRLFRYDRAYELAEQWLILDASVDGKLNMMLADISTNRFEDCTKQAAMIDDATFPAPAIPMILIRDSMKLTCQWGAGQKAAAQETEKALLSKSVQMQSFGWESTGTRHFLATSPAFEAGRSSWIALFESLDKGDAAAMAGALQQLEEVTRR